MRDIKWNADRQTDKQMAFHSYNIDNYDLWLMSFLLICHTYRLCTSIACVLLDYLYSPRQYRQALPHKISGCIEISE